jgi:hypothetical protein
MVNWLCSTKVRAVRVAAGNVDPASNQIEIACDGQPIFDEYRSLGLFGMDKQLKWAHVYGTSMEPEGIGDGEFIAYQAVSVSNGYKPQPEDVVLVKIEGKKSEHKLHGGFKLRKILALCENGSSTFEEITYDKEGKPHTGIAKLELNHGKVLFQ